MVNTYYSMLPLHIKICIFEKHSNFNFWWYFKVPQANCLWVDFGKSWQIWIGQNTLQLAMVESIPEARLKSSNSLTMNPYTTWSVSLVSYHPYLPPQKV